MFKNALIVKYRLIFGRGKSKFLVIIKLPVEIAYYAFQLLYSKLWKVFFNVYTLQKFTFHFKLLEAPLGVEIKIIEHHFFAYLALQTFTHSARLLSQRWQCLLPLLFFILYFLTFVYITSATFTLAYLQPTIKRHNV